MLRRVSFVRFRVFDRDNGYGSVNAWVENGTRIIIDDKYFMHCITGRFRWRSSSIWSNAHCPFTGCATINSQRIRYRLRNRRPFRLCRSLHMARVLYMVGVCGFQLKICDRKMMMYVSMNIFKTIKVCTIRIGSFVWCMTYWLESFALSSDATVESE